MATGFGLLPVRKLVGGGQIQTNVYSVPATDSTALYVGDVVELVDSMDAGGQVATVKALASATNVPLGVVVGFLQNPDDLYVPNYRKASVARYVIVADDLINTVFQAQEDAVGGSVSAANIGGHYNISVITAAGSVYTGMSGTMLDSSTAVNTALNFKLVGVARLQNNVAAQTGGAILEVVGLVSAFNQNASHS
jgi:hypothetical protein